MNFSCKNEIIKFIDYDIEELGIKHNSEGYPLLTVDPSHFANPYAISAVVRQALKDLGTMDCDLAQKAKSKLERIGQAEHEKYLEKKKADEMIALRQNVRLCAGRLADRAIRNASLVYHRKTSEGPAGAGSSTGEHESKLKAESSASHREEDPWPIASKYILNQIPKGEFWYGAFVLFAKKSKKVIKLYIDKIRENPSLELGCLLRELGLQRNIIAYRTHTPDKENFGVLRTTIKDCQLISPISGYSKEYNIRIREKLDGYLEKTSFLNDPSLELTGYYTNRIITYNKACTLPRESIKWGFDEFSFFYTLEDFEPIYQFVRLLKIDEETYPISTYVISGNKTKTERAVRIIHMNSSLIESLTDKIKDVFKNTINWDKQDINELVGMVGYLQYVIAHMCPYARGSAAVCEWIERIIYQYHGLEVRYNPDKCINLEALTSSLEEFLRVYPSCIRLYTK
jgi:hypothetical protein